ncbi:sugar phosphate nucleotidyltransferase [Solemya velesiana gill symbiont]|uniref:sugar phosphate nucleotidyltransferase n=1 Tax=Solemya velesiana gill symbiont TaxID=1918948 RepID=UPI001082927E|nr:sugar phosphate nucleotidyltransferase [Solemya velesiana gill symbiont]
MTGTDIGRVTNPGKAVILAGGSGMRLWSITRLHLPRQFLRLEGNKTLPGHFMSKAE